VARTSAGILVLLGFLLLMNGIAIFLRQRLERRW
jgi:phosphate transport system permease protein